MMYKLGDEFILRMEDMAGIPLDMGNVDYLEYLDWLEQGNVPLPADPEPMPFASCSPWQVRKALNQMGLRQQVEDAVAASDDYDLKDGWLFALNIDAGSDFTLALGAVLGKNEWEVYQLILWASTL